MLAGGIVTVLGMAALPLTEYLPTSVQTAWPIVSQVIVTAGWSMLNINLVPSLMAVTAGRNRNRAFAVNGALRGLGTFLGAVSGGLLPGLFSDLLHATSADPTPYGLALWVGAAVGVLGLIPLSAVGEAKPVGRGEVVGSRGSFPLMPVTLMISYVCLRHGGWATSRAFYNAYVDTVLHLSASSIGLITGVAQFAAMLAALLTPRLASRRSNGWTLMVTTLGLVVSLLPLALIPHWGAAGLSQLGVLVLSAIWMPAFQVFQMELVEPQWRSLSYGAVSMAMGFSFGLVSLLGGYVIAAGGYRSLFTLGVVLTTASSAVIAYIHNSLDPERARPP
jgi:MFS family permease